jgi:hypothetical protein
VVGKGEQEQERGVGWAKKGGGKVEQEFNIEHVNFERLHVTLS